MAPGAEGEPYGWPTAPPKHASMHVRIANSMTEARQHAYLTGAAAYGTAERYGRTHGADPQATTSRRGGFTCSSCRRLVTSRPGHQQTRSPRSPSQYHNPYNARNGAGPAAHQVRTNTKSMRKIKRTLCNKRPLGSSKAGKWQQGHSDNASTRGCPLQLNTSARQYPPTMRPR